MVQLACQLLTLALFPPAGSGAPHVQESVAIVGCTVVPMDGERVLEDMTVVVSDGAIRSMGAVRDILVPEGARVIQADGAWLLPGLTDMHVHVGDESERLLYLRYGVTAVCNLGGDGLDLFSGDRLDILDLRRRIRAGELAGPDIYTTGIALDGDPATGPFQTPVPDVETAAELVRAQHAAGFDFIKVYDALPSEIHAAIVRAARAQGMSVFGHVPEAIGVEATLVSGQAVITHAEEYFGAYEGVEGSADDLPRLARLTRAAHVVVIPNVSFIQNVLLQLDDLQERLDRPDVEFIAPSVRRSWEPRYNYLVRRDDPEAFEQQMREKLVFGNSLTRALHEERVPLLAGSDASVPTAIPGLALHEELQHLVSLGLTPFEALCTATANVQAFFREHLPSEADFGTLQAGQRANLLLLERNPLDSLQNLKSVLGVMVRGHWYTRAELDLELAEIAAGFER